MPNRKPKSMRPFLTYEIVLPEVALLRDGKPVAPRVREVDKHAVVRVEDLADEELGRDSMSTNFYDNRRERAYYLSSVYDRSAHL